MSSNVMPDQNESENESDSNSDNSNDKSIFSGKVYEASEKVGIVRADDEFINFFKKEAEGEIEIERSLEENRK